MFKHVIYSSFPSVSSKSNVITYLAVGAESDFTKYWKKVLYTQNFWYTEH